MKVEIMKSGFEDGLYIVTIQYKGSSWTMRTTNYEEATKYIGVFIENMD